MTPEYKPQYSIDLTSLRGDSRNQLDVRTVACFLRDSEILDFRDRTKPTRFTLFSIIAYNPNLDAFDTMKLQINFPTNALDFGIDFEEDGEGIFFSLKSEDGDSTIDVLDTIAKDATFQYHDSCLKLLEYGYVPRAIVGEEPIPLKEIQTLKKAGFIVSPTDDSVSEESGRYMVFEENSSKNIDDEYLATGNNLGKLIKTAYMFIENEQKQSQNMVP